MAPAGLGSLTHATVPVSGVLSRNAMSPTVVLPVGRLVDEDQWCWCGKRHCEGDTLVHAPRHLPGELRRVRHRIESERSEQCWHAAAVATVVAQHFRDLVADTQQWAQRRPRF